MNRRRGFAPLAGALLLAGGAIAAWRFLGEDGDGGAVEPAAGGAVRAARAPGGEPAAPAFSADPRPPPTHTEPEPADADRVAEIARREIRVHVVDRERRPVARVPVALGAIGGESRASHAVARSDEAGIALIGDYDGAVEAAPAGTDWCVYLPFPEIGSSIEPVDPRHPPPDPIELVAPPLGRLVVRVEDAAGRPVSAAGELTLTAFERGPARPRATTPLPLALTAPGELVVDPIAAGLRVRVDAWLAEHAPESVEGDGPARAGETAVLRLRLPRRGPVVTGKLVRSDGRPAGGLDLLGTVHDDPERRSRFGDVRLATAADGRFRFDASKYELEEPMRPRWLDLMTVSRAPGEGGRARAALPIPFAEGEHEVGNVTFEPSPLLVAGTVVDGRGEPVAGAQVCVVRRELASAALLRRGAAGDVAFGRSDGRGAFALSDFLDAGDRVVLAFDAERESLPLAFEAGRRDVALALRGSGALEGSLVMDGEGPSILVSLLLRRADLPDGSRGPFGSATAPGQGGGFRWERVREGRVDVAVALGRDVADPEIVLVVPDVEVLPGAVNREPRLASLDLRSRIPRARVEVVGPGGARVDDGVVVLLAAAPPHAPVLTVRMNEGAAELPTLRPTFDVEVRAPGMRSERRFGLVSPARIELRPGIPVELAFDPPFRPRSEAPAVALRLVLTPLDAAAGGAGSQQRVDLDDAGRGGLLLAEAGRFRVELEASRDFPRASSRESGQDEARAAARRFSELREQLERAFGAPRIVVPEGASAQRIAIPLPAVARELLARMGGELAR